MGTSKYNNPGEAPHALFAEVETHRTYMLRFATAKLRDADQAEAVVPGVFQTRSDGTGNRRNIYAGDGPPPEDAPT